MMCIITKNVRLLPWVVCVSGISSYFDDGSWISIAAFLLSYWGTRWWNILKLNYELRRCHSSVTSDWWTIYICELSLSEWTVSSRHLYGLRSEMLLFQLLLMEHHPSIIFLICNLVNEHSSILHSFHRRLPHQDCSWNSESWLTTFWVISEKLYNIVNYDSRLGILLL